jgi:integrase
MATLMVRGKTRDGKKIWMNPDPQKQPPGSEMDKDQDGKQVWMIRVFVDGKQKGFTFHGGQRAAEREAVKAENRREQGETVTPSRMKVADYLNEWLQTYQKQEVTKVTFADNCARLKKHVFPVLGDKKLSTFSTMDCQRIINGLANDGKTRTAVIVYNLLKKSMRKAVDLGYLVKSPMDAVTKPKDRAQERPSLTIEQAAVFLEAAKSESLHALFAFLLLTGVRPEEAFGLKWDDVNLNERTVSIRRSVQRVPGGGWEFSDLKTATSRRNLDLGAQLTDILRAHKREQAKVRLAMGEDWTDNGLVFANHARNPLDISHVRKRLAKVLSRAGLPAIRLYDLRHWHGSMLLDQGVNIKAISDRLGHANTSMTVNRYLHAQRSHSQEAVIRLDAAISAVGKKGEEQDAK